MDSANLTLMGYNIRHGVGRTFVGGTWRKVEGEMGVEVIVFDCIRI